MHIDGLILINKTSGISTYDIIRKIKRNSNEIKLGHTKKIKLGHTGTLDPIAEGLVVVMVGQTNKLRFFFENDNKLYLAKMKLGYRSDTFDSEGELEKTNSLIPTEEVVRNTLKIKTGKYQQVPPQYSAVKVNGKPAYYWKREKNIDLKLKSKEVNVYSKFCNMNNDNVEFYAKVSKGTYIRSLINDVGEEMCCGAYMTSLKRLTNGPFKVFDALNYDDIGPESLLNSIVSNEEFFSKYEKYYIDEFYKKNISNGILLDKSLFGYVDGKQVYGDYLPVYSGEELVCFIERICEKTKNIVYKRVLIADN